MVVKTFNTVTADAAVTTARSSHCSTIRAKLRTVDCLQKISKANFVVNNITRAYESGKKEEQEARHCENEVYGYLDFSQTTESCKHLNDEAR